MNNVTLIGMPGAGKSTVGVLLAKTLGFDFLDTDILLQQRRGALLQKLLDELGAQGFLAAEEALLAGLDCQNTVIAPGGSAVCEEQAMARLKELGPVVYLHLPCGEIEQRLANIDSRGVVMAPGQTVRDLYSQRVPLCRRYADLTIDAAGQTPEETVRAVLRELITK